jgi:exosortase A
MSSVMPSMPSRPLLPAAWRLAVPLFLLLLLSLLLLYRDTGLAMVGIWQRSDTFAHAFVVPPISLWLIWRQREALALLTPRPGLLFAIPFALAALGWLLGDLVAVNALTQFALVSLLVLSVPLVLGWQVAWQIAFPLAFLFFSVPVGEFMMPALMEATADFTVAALRLTGVPVFREGLQFVIPSGNWSVVEACSGLRYLVASVMVGTLFAYLNYNSLRKRLVFIAVAFVLPLVANWVRAYLIVMLGHLSGNELAAGADHLVYGWVFFGVVMLALFMIGARWAEPVAPLPAPQAGAAVGGRVPLWAGAALGLLLSVAPLLVLRALASGAPAQPVELSAPALPGWSTAEPPGLGWKPVYEKPAAELQTGYRRDGRPLGLYIAYYRAQDYASKLISSQHQLARADDKQWARVGGDTRALDLGTGRLTLRTAELRGSGLPAEQRLLVWQFYWVDARLTASDVRAKLYGAWQRLAGRGDDAAALIVYTLRDAAAPGRAEADLQDFLQQHWPAIEAQLRQTAARR